MWWSRRSLLLAAVAFAGCGFTPVYGPGGSAEGLRGSIAIDAPADEDGFALVRQLQDRLGQADTARYRLSAAINVSETGLGITPDQDVTRIRLRGQLRYRIRATDSEIVLTNGVVEGFTGYSAPVVTSGDSKIAGNTVSVLTAERDARQRLMVILADRLVTRLLATAADWQQ